VLLIGAQLFGQSARDSLTFTTNNFQSKILTSNFDKQLTTYNFNTALKYNFESNNLFFGINENFRSTIIKSATKNIRDEQYLSYIGEYAWTDFIRFGIYGNNTLYSDNRQLAINEASVLNTIGYSIITPVENFSIIPFTGYSVNKQIGESDKGYIYGTEAEIQNFRLSDFNINSTLKFQNEDISPRKNTARLLSVNISNQFEQLINNTISVHYSEQRKDFYFEADSITQSEFDITNNIQSRTESNYYLQDRLFYISPSSGLSLDFLGKISWRDIDRDTRYVSLDNISTASFDTRIDEFKIDFATSAEYRTESFFGNIRLGFAEREEKHSPKRIEEANSIYFDNREEKENQKNNNSQQINLAITGKLRVSENDDVAFTFLQRKLIYDTPSDLNYDDRDEVLTIFGLRYNKQLTPFFDMFVDLQGSINHIVYIFSERSSNNNFRRILKLSSGGNYRSKYFSSNNSAEVSVNYTVYDFEEINPAVTSFAFRQFTLRDSSSVYLNKRTSLKATGYIKLSEQGDFDWTNFSSKPARYLSEYYIEPMIVFSNDNILMGIGARYFRLITYNYNSSNEKQMASDYTSAGPLIQFYLFMAPRLSLKIDGWYEFITTESEQNRELANLNIKMRWQL